MQTAITILATLFLLLGIGIKNNTRVSINGSQNANAGFETPVIDPCNGDPLCIYY